MRTPRNKESIPQKSTTFFGVALIFSVVFLLELLWADVPVGWALVVALLSAGVFLVYNRPFRRMAARSSAEGDRMRRSPFARLVPLLMLVAGVGYLWANGIGVAGFFDRANAQRIVGIVAFLLVTAWPVFVSVRGGKR